MSENLPFVSTIPIDVDNSQTIEPQGQDQLTFSSLKQPSHRQVDLDESKNAPNLPEAHYPNAADPVSSDQEESKSSQVTVHTDTHTVGRKSNVQSQTSHTLSKRRNILEEELNRFDDCEEEANETDFCIKGYDYDNRSTYNQYTLLYTIADAQYSSIALCQTNNTFEKFVMKQLRRGVMRKNDRTAYLDAMREMDIHKMLRHPNIVRLHEVIDDSADDKAFLIMDYARIGRIMEHRKETNTFAYLGKPDFFLPEKDVRMYAEQILRALVYLHNKKIMHLDIKPQNILIDGDQVAKIADFGTSQIFYQEDMDQILSHRGTWEFMAPECFKQGNKTACYSGRKADVWAYGLCIYALAFNDLPFTMSQGIETRHAHKNMQEQDLCFADQSRPISDALKDFLRKALANEPSMRASVFELAEHHWLTSNDYF